MPDALPPADLLEHAAFVRRLAFHLLRDDAAADDVAQDTALRALERPPRGATGLRAWLATVVRRTASNARRGEARRRVREHAVARPEGALAADDVAARAEIVRKVGEAVRALDAESQRVIFLRHYEDLPPRDIAARLGIPVETVRSRLRRAHERLRARLDERHGAKENGWRASLAGLVGFADPGVTAAAGEGVAMGLATKVAVGVAAVTLLAVGAWLVLAPRGDVEPLGGAGLVRSAPPAPELASAVPSRVPGLAGMTASEAGTADAGETPAEGANPRTITLVDVADGKPLPRVRIRLGAKEFTSDAEGLIDLDEADLDRALTVLTPGWHTSWKKPQRARKLLPLDAVLSLRGRVRAEGPLGRSLDLSQVSLAGHGVQDRDIPLLDVRSGKGTFHWLRANRFDEIDLKEVRLAPDGTFETTVPRLRRVAISASTPGWAARPTDVVVPEDPTNWAEVEVVLRPVPTIAGVVLDPEGRPLGRDASGQPIHVAVHVARRWAEPPDPIEFVGNHAKSLTGHHSYGVRIRMILSARTDDAGRFSTDLTVDGDVTVETHPTGFLPIWHRLPRDRWNESITLTAARNVDRWVTIVRGSEPYQGTLSFIDLTDVDVQVGVGGGTTDERGRVNLPWLAEGRVYNVHGSALPHSTASLFRWDGKDVIDLARLVSFEDIHPR